MALNVTTPARARPVPKSPIARSNRLTIMLAKLHDARLARKHADAARRELRGLDDRMLRDIGLNHVMLEEIERDQPWPKHQQQQGLRGVWRKLHNSALFRPRSRPSGSQY